MEQLGFLVFSITAQLSFSGGVCLCVFLFGQVGGWLFPEQALGGAAVQPGGAVRPLRSSHNTKWAFMLLPLVPYLWVLTGRMLSWACDIHIEELHLRDQERRRPQGQWVQLRLLEASRDTVAHAQCGHF